MGLAQHPKNGGRGRGLSQYVIPAGHFPQKSSSRNLRIGFSSLLTAKPCPFTFDTWPHRVLYWLGTGLWCLGLAHASLPYMSKICLLLMCLPWLACTVGHPFFTIFWFPFLLWLALLRGWSLLDGGLRLSLAHPFFPAPISYHIILSFLLRSCLPQSCQASLGLPFILLPMAQYDHWFFYFITGRLLCPICFFFRASLTHLLFLDFPGP